MKLFKCNHCGNVVEKIVDSGVGVVCCGEPMVELTANTTDAALEKHVPVLSIDGDILTAKVGEDVYKRQLLLIVFFLKRKYA